MQQQTPRLAGDRGQPLMRRVCVWSWRVGFCLLFLLPKGGKKNHNMERHQVYYLKFPLLQKLASQAASGTLQWYPSMLINSEGQELTTCSVVVSPTWSHSLTPIRWEPALCSALRGTQSSWSHPNIGVLVDEPPRKSQKLQDLLPWPPDSSKCHYSWKPEELLGCVLRQLTFSVLKQAYGKVQLFPHPDNKPSSKSEWPGKSNPWMVKDWAEQNLKTITSTNTEQYNQICIF